MPGLKNTIEAVALANKFLTEYRPDEPDQGIAPDRLAEYQEALASPDTTQDARASFLAQIASALTPPSPDPQYFVNFFHMLETNFGMTFRG